MDKKYLIFPVLIILFPFLFIFQGLDFTDMGFVLTNQFQTLHAPSSVLYRFFTWLSNILGGYWINIFGNFSIFGSRLGAALSYLIICLIVFQILKKHLTKIHLYFGLLLSELFILKDTGTWLNYNKFTSLFLFISLFFLIRGTVKQKNHFLLISAFFLSLNVYVRLPNLVAIVLISVPFYHNYITDRDPATFIKAGLIFIVGFMGGLLAITAILFLYKQEGLVYNSLIQYLTMIRLGSSEPSQSIFAKYMFDIGMVIIITLILFPLLFILSKAISKTHHFRYFFILFFAIIGCLILYKGGSWRWVYFGPVVLIHLLYIFNRKQSSAQFRTIVFASLMVFVTTPLGSHNGLLNQTYGMWLAIPVSLHYLLGLDKIQFTKFQLTLIETKTFKTLVIITTIFFSLLSGYRETYRDSQNRFALHSQVDSPRLQLVFTTPERASVVKELLVHLKSYVQPGDYLLAYEGIPLIHFLTETKPYLQNPWPMLYTSKILKRVIKKRETTIEQLPIIVRAKYSTFNHNWPQSKKPLRSRYNDDRTLLTQFVREHSYSTVWNNEFFEILQPKNITK